MNQLFHDQVSWHTLLLGAEVMYVKDHLLIAGGLIVDHDACVSFLDQHIFKIS